MTTLRLAIDAREMRQGADVGVRAVKDIQDASKRATDELRNLGSAGTGSVRSLGGFRDAVQATGGIAQAGQGFAAIGREIQNVGSFSELAANSSFLLSRGLLEVVRVGEDLRQLRVAQQMQGLATSSNAFLLLWRANPLLTIATGISLVATAMSLFSSSTKKATEESKKQVDVLRELSDEAQRLATQSKLFGAAGVPFASPLQSSKGILDVLQKLRSDPGTLARGRISVGSGAEALGITEQELRIALGRSGVGEEALAIRPRRAAGTSPGLQGVQSQYDFLRSEFSIGQFERAATFLAQQRQQQETERELLNNFQQRAPQPTVGEAPAGAEYGPGQREAELQSYLRGLQQETALLGMSEAKRQQAVAVIEAENIARQQGLALSDDARRAITEEISLQQQMNEMRQLGEQAGEALGSAFFSIVSGANSARQAVAQLIQQLAQLAQGAAIRGLGQAIGQAFGGTAAQATPVGPTTPSGGAA